MVNEISECPTADELLLAVKAARRREKFVQLLKNTFASFIVALAVIMIISAMFFPLLRMTGTSMEPVLEPDNLIVCRRTADCSPGDIIAFYYNDVILVKRVVAKEGDVVMVNMDGTVLVNGNEFPERFPEAVARGICDIDMPCTVPEKSVFVMGDSRAASLDSRSSMIGCIYEEKIVGVLLFRIFPFKEAGKVA